MITPPLYRVRTAALLAFVLIGSLNLRSQDISQANRDLQAFISQASVGVTPAACDQLLSATNQYIDILRNGEVGSSDYLHAKASLKDIFDKCLIHPIDFYSKRHDYENTMLFSNKYLEISLMGVFTGEDQLIPNSTIFYFVGKMALDHKDYENCRTALKAYLSTSDSKLREDAYFGIVSSCYNTRNFSDLKFMASEALKEFPNGKHSWNIATMAIQVCGELLHDDRSLAKFLEAALVIRPDDPSLLQNVANYHERQQNYSKALSYYERLDQLAPNTLGVFVHLAYDHYNVGVQWYQKALQTTDAVEKEGHMAESKRYFALAAPLLQRVLDNEPYATPVAHALALCYSEIGDTQNLKAANNTLAALNKPQVTTRTEVTLMNDYDIHNAQAAVYSVPDPIETFISDVDMDIPQAPKKNENMYAIVIGNEKYSVERIGDVAYAESDAHSMADYCKKTLGMPDENVSLITNATLAQITQAVKRVTELSKMKPGKLSVLFYYAGHGVPDKERSSAYLLPVDVDGSDLDVCYELDKLYAQFDELNIRNATVFLDACFTGATREGSMIYEHRFAGLEPKEAEVKNKTIVFSATSQSQTAMPFREQQHGYFTYFLLKNLKESNGHITFQQLADNLMEQVDFQAYSDENQHQTPRVKYPKMMGDSWKNLTLVTE